MKKIERSSDHGADRYKYDFKLCTIANGWAQLDTGQDAHYFGTWINPAKRQTLCYCEGDVTLVTLDTDGELVEEIERVRAWNDEQGHGFKGIDPCALRPLYNALVGAGLKNYVHASAQAYFDGAEN